MPQADGDRRLNPESTRVVLDLAAKDYADENDRTRALDGKTGPLIAVTGAAMLFVAGVLTKPPEGLGMFASGLYFAGVGLSLFALVVAQVFFLVSLRTREFRRTDLGQWVLYSTMESEVSDIRAELAGTYESAVKHNSLLNEKKAIAYERGLVLLATAIMTLVAVLTAATAATLLLNEVR